MRMRAESSSRKNFASRLVRELFTIEERKTSNVRGIKKLKLDEDKIAYVRKMTFKLYPLEGGETEIKAWSQCITAIDEANRRLNRPVIVIQ